jgi:hypothetical protein
MKNKYIKTQVVRGGERMFVHPYAYNPSLPTVFTEPDKVHWIATDQGIMISPIDLESIPLVSYTLKNLGYRWKTILMSLWFGFRNTNGIAKKFKRLKDEVGYTIENARWQFSNCFYYPVKAKEVFERMQLHGTYHLVSDEFNINYLCPSDLSIELALEWENDAYLNNELPADSWERELGFAKVERYARFREWRKVMLDNGYAIGYIVELDT